MAFQAIAKYAGTVFWVESVTFDTIRVQSIWVAEPAYAFAAKSRRWLHESLSLRHSFDTQEWLTGRKTDE